MTRGIRARIDRSALKHNLDRAAQSAPGSRIMAVVKADGYGHGLTRVALTLADSADAFAVESTAAGVELREAGIGQDIVLLSGFHEASELEAITHHRLTLVVHHGWQVEALTRGARPGSVGVWVKIDTGMHRAGFPPGELPQVLEALDDAAHVRIDGLMSHLANADDLSDPATPEQCRVFEQAAGDVRPRSLANSPGILGWPATHFEWVRPGMMLYGCTPIQGRSEADLDLRPAMTLESQIIAAKIVPAGGAVGYGGSWRCEADTRVGLLACGYGDGYPRHAPSGTPVRVNGYPGAVLGRVSMDLMTIDLSNCEAGVGDWVELWGKHVAASVVAAHAGTIPYELVTRVNSRVPRIYED